MTILYPDNAVTVLTGTTVRLDLAVTLDDIPVNLTGASLYMSVRVSPEAHQPLIFKSVGSGIVVTDASSGLATVTLTAAETALLMPAEYYYDVLLDIPSGDNAGTYVVVPQTILSVKKGITRI